MFTRMVSTIEVIYGHLRGRCRLQPAAGAKILRPFSCKIGCSAAKTMLTRATGTRHIMTYTHAASLKTHPRQCVVDVVAAVHQGQERALGSLPPPHRWYSCVRNTDRVHASCKRAALAQAELAQAATCSAAGFAGCCCSLLLCCVPLDAAHSLHLSCALRFIASATAFAFAPRSTFAMAAAARPPWASQCPSLLPAPLRAPPWPPFFS